MGVIIKRVVPAGVIWHLISAPECGTGWAPDGITDQPVLALESHIFTCIWYRPASNCNGVPASTTFGDLISGRGYGTGWAPNVITGWLVPSLGSYICTCIWYRPGP
jgi:hypothetical protein